MLNMKGTYLYIYQITLLTSGMMSRNMNKILTNIQYSKKNLEVP